MGTRYSHNDFLSIYVVLQNIITYFYIISFYSSKLHCEEDNSSYKKNKRNIILVSRLEKKQLFSDLNLNSPGILVF